MRRRGQHVSHSSGRCGLIEEDGVCGQGGLLCSALLIIHLAGSTCGMRHVFTSATKRRQVVVNSIWRHSSARRSKLNVAKWPCPLASIVDPTVPSPCRRGAGPWPLAHPTAGCVGWWGQWYFFDFSSKPKLWEICDGGVCNSKWLRLDFVGNSLTLLLSEELKQGPSTITKKNGKISKESRPRPRRSHRKTRQTAIRPRARCSSRGQDSPGCQGSQEPRQQI